ncbi:MAG: aspartate aminotransferase family protein [Anaerolineae bacterium]|nr:aspartate aminotransferase family protein [Anaerolineae bacterium]MCB0255797.1 aspartate aminotransferase family protein [Anaerolineae bacterium]
METSHESTNELVEGNLLPQDLYSLAQALELGRTRNSALHRSHLNPRHVALAELVQIDKPLIRAYGPFFWDSDGNQYLDFLGGFAALLLGHNHPRLNRALRQVDELPGLVEGLSILSAALAHNLAVLAPGDLNRVYFANSGAEVVDAAIKLARAATGRTRLVACSKGFHGRTVGALSLMDRREYHDPFAPLLAGVRIVPFGDTDALEAALCRSDVAACVVEPIQGEGGIVVPPAGYLTAARALCTQYGTLLVVDEVQTGLGRTGRLFAVNAEAVIPDVLLLGKALGGGVMPLSALLTTDRLYFASKGNTVRTPFHTSTYGGNSRACAVGLAMLEVLIEEDLVQQAHVSGDYFLARLRDVQRRQPLIADVRGSGLMIGVEFVSATRGLATLATAGLVNRLSRDFLSALIIQRMLVHHRVFLGMTLNNSNVIRFQPPLNVEKKYIDYVISTFEETLDFIGSFPRAALRAVPDLVDLMRA